METGKLTETDILGNTNAKISSLRGHNWCFTLNNYEHLESGKLDIIKQWIIDNCEKCNAGYEVGSNGTPHIQGFIKCKTNIRFNKLREVCRAIHWEKCKGTEEQNFNYTNKDGDIWISFGCEKLEGKKAPPKLMELIDIDWTTKGHTELKTFIDSNSYYGSVVVGDLIPTNTLRYCKRILEWDLINVADYANCRIMPYCKKVKTKGVIVYGIDHTLTEIEKRNVRAGLDALSTGLYPGIAEREPVRVFVWYV